MLMIGEKLKRLRLASNLTQDELAARTELTKGYISQLERDLTSPSLATLNQILEVLGDNLSDFFYEKQTERVVFTPQESTQSTKSEKGFNINLLVPNSHNNEMEPVLVKLEPGAKTWEDRQHSGEEFGYVLKGEVILYYGRTKYKLSQGDCFYFKSDRKHLIKNDGSIEAEILWVVAPPTF